MSRLRGRWCDLCNGRGSLPASSGGRDQFGRFVPRHLDNKDIRECPRCHWVGFVGLTSDEVRLAEIECHTPTQPPEHDDDMQESLP